MACHTADPNIESSNAKGRAALLASVLQVSYMEASYAALYTCK